MLQHLLDESSREAIIGDLYEGYLTSRRKRGPIAAYWWYWTNAIRSLITCRVTGQRQQEERRFDFDGTARTSLRDVLRPALRQFRDQPLYSLACTGTLALAVGVACVSLAVVKRALLDQLPYRDSHELVSLLTLAEGMTSAVSTHVLEDLRASGSPLVEFAPIRPTGAAYQSPNGTENVSISYVSLDYFVLLGASPMQGRVWTPEESNAVVISEAFWNEKLARVPTVVGSSLTLDGRPRIVVGVMPAGFMPPYFSITDAWAPIDMATLLADIRTRRPLTVLARLAADASQQDVDAYLAVFSQQLNERFPAMHGGQAWVARPLRDELVGTARPALVGTAAAAGLLLLIVGANIAGLSTARAVSMRHQLAVRAALGATRGRLLIEQLMDGMVLALTGALAGVWIAYVLVKVVARYQQFFLSRLSPITLDMTTVVTGLAAGLVIGVAAALLPQRIVAALPSEALRTTRGSSADARATATRTALVMAQVAIALVLLVGAGLLVRTVQHLSDRDLGFDRTGLSWLQVTLPGSKYQSTAAQLQFEQDAVQRLSGIAGVRSSIASVGFPLWGGMMAGLALKGDAPGAPRREVAYLSVAPNFVKDVGARILAGRDLQPSDTVNSPRVVVINETMARTFWPNGDAIGAEVQIGPGSPKEQWITVIGVMADMRAHGVAEAVRPTAFGSTLQYSWPRRHLAVRTAAEPPPTLATEMKAAIHAVDPAVAIGVATSAEQVLFNSLARHRLVMLSLSLFGGVALVLCISGLYAVIALSSQQRRREYAIRIALGASGHGVRWMVVRQALMLAAAGAAVGLVCAGLGTRAIQGLLHGVQPVDTTTFATATILLLTLSIVAAWQPARRAERVNPVETLRAE
jgi:predicted permease